MSSSSDEAEAEQRRNVKRLLHPGAETKDVIAQYISTIRCLRILDPPGVLLHKVADPIRRHLKDRPDTVKCVVATLVEGEELQDENEAGGLIQASHDDAVESFSDPSWEPEPFDAAPRKSIQQSSWLSIDSSQNSALAKLAISSVPSSASTIREK